MEKLQEEAERTLALELRLSVDALREVFFGLSNVNLMARCSQEEHEALLGALVGEQVSLDDLKTALCKIYENCIRAFLKNARRHAIDRPLFRIRKGMMDDRWMRRMLAGYLTWRSPAYEPPIRRADYLRPMFEALFPPPKRGANIGKKGLDAFGDASLLDHYEAFHLGPLWMRERGFAEGNGDRKSDRAWAEDYLENLEDRTKPCAPDDPLWESDIRRVLQRLREAKKRDAGLAE